MSKPYRAGVVPLSVVAVKKPGQFIVRAMSPFASMTDLVRGALQYVGCMDPELEWTGYTYGGWPGYVVYGAADLPRIGWPTGVFRFDCKHAPTEAEPWISEQYGPPIRLGDIR